MTTSSEPAAGLLPATRRALTHRVAVGQAEGRTPSLSAAVVRDGGQAWFGSRSMLDGHEPDGDTQYRIGSLTKTFIAVLVMRLRDEGCLDLADPLGKHLDAGEAAGATIAQLLSHTAGLASETPGPWWERSPGELRPGLAGILSPAPHPAGRLFHYSNPGYGLLGALVGQLRGHGWEEALRQEILDPLGMARTTLAPEEPHARGFAVHPWADVMQLEPADPAGLMAPAGELWSTAEDLCRFGVFLLDGDDRVLPAATLAEMRAPASPPGDEAWAGGYGLGLQLFRQDGRVLYGHSGSMPGFLATLCVSPADAVGAITLANATSGPDISGIACDLVRIVTDSEPRLPDRWQPLPEADQGLLALTGPWYWGPRAYVLRLVAGRGLELGPATGRGRASRFRAQSDGTWTGLDGYYTGETLRLVRGPDGTVDHLDLGSFVFTREPYGPGGPDGPLAARPDPEGWRAFLVSTCSCGRDAARDELGELAGDAAVGVEVRVEDRHVQAAGAWPAEQALQQPSRFVPAQAAWVAVVDGGHDGVVEDIDVEVHPVTLELRLGHGGQRSVEDRRDGPGAQVPVVQHGDAAVPDVLAAEPVVVAEDPVTDQRDVVGPHQRCEPVQVGERPGAAAGRQGQVQRGDLPVRFVGGVLEVGVPVQEDQAIAAPPPQGQQRAQDNAAVAAQHHGEPAGLQRGLDDAGQREGHLGDAAGVEHAGGHLTPVVIGGHGHVLRVVAAQPGMQADGPERRGRQFHAARAQPQRRGDLDDQRTHPMPPARFGSEPIVTPADQAARRLRPSGCDCGTRTAPAPVGGTTDVRRPGWARRCRGSSTWCGSCMAKSKKAAAAKTAPKADAAEADAAE